MNTYVFKESPLITLIINHIIIMVVVYFRLESNTKEEQLWQHQKNC